MLLQKLRLFYRVGRYSLFGFNLLKLFNMILHPPRRSWEFDDLKIIRLCFIFPKIIELYSIILYLKLVLFLHEFGDLKINIILLVARTESLNELRIDFLEQLRSRHQLSVRLILEIVLNNLVAKILELLKVHMAIRNLRDRRIRIPWLLRCCIVNWFVS